MKRTLVYCHPYDKSFNAAIKSVIIDVHTKNDLIPERVFFTEELNSAIKIHLPLLNTGKAILDVFARVEM